MNARKINPRRKPCTQADVDRARSEAFAETADYMLTAMIWCLSDDMGVSDEFLQTLSCRFDSLNESITRGNIRLEDIRKALKEEHDWEINITIPEGKCK